MQRAATLCFPRCQFLIQGTVEVDDLVRWIEDAARANCLDGVTISGGEPMEQAPALFDLLTRLRTRQPGLSLGLFSGYSKQELDGGRFHCYPETHIKDRQDLWVRIRGLLDFAVLGRYNQARPAFDPLVSSKNQKLHLCSNLHSLADFSRQSVEITIDDAGLTQLTGFPRLGSPAKL